MMSCTSLTIATSALVGVILAPNPRLATLPLGLTYGCMMLMMIPASLFMRHYGRRAGFTLGGYAGMLAGATSAVGIYSSSFLLFCIGSTIFGVASGLGQYYRFAAAEIVDESYKSRAISWVLLGGLVAAFIGPNGASLTRDLIPDALFSASYALVALFSFGIILTQLFIRIPTPSIDESLGHKRPLRKILTGPTFLVAALCAMAAYGTMNLLMTVTPLAMHDRNMDFGATVFVIQWHIVGMFAPSFFTGSLIDRFGVLKIMFAGALILVTCAGVALSGQLYSHFIVGLVMLGIGWNFLDVGGGATKERVAEALKIILSDDKVKGILVNIFGGIVRCDLIAEGIIAAVAEVNISVPIVVRLEGTKATEGTAILNASDLNLIAAQDLGEAAAKIVAAVGEAK